MRDIPSYRAKLAHYAGQRACVASVFRNAHHLAGEMGFRWQVAQQHPLSRQRPLWVISGHRVTFASCPLYPPKADIRQSTTSAAVLSSERSELGTSVTRAAVVRDPSIAAGIGQFAIIQSVSPSVGVDVTPVDVRDPAEIERAVTGSRPDGESVVCGLSWSDRLRRRRRPCPTWSCR
jgi:hypothetical protein